MKVSAREHTGAGGRAYACGVEVGVSQSTLSQSIYIWSVDRSAETAKAAVSNVIKNQENHIG
jgi:hypothetical protein